VQLGLRNLVTREAKHAQEDKRGVTIVVVLVDELLLDATLENAKEEVDKQLVKLHRGTCRQPATSKNLREDGGKKVSSLESR
jgi:hypothetical protein